MIDSMSKFLAIHQLSLIYISIFADLLSLAVRQAFRKTTLICITQIFILVFSSAFGIKARNISEIITTFFEDIDPKSGPIIDNFSFKNLTLGKIDSHFSAYLLSHFRSLQYNPIHFLILSNDFYYPCLLIFFSSRQMLAFSIFPSFLKCLKQRLLSLFNQLSDIHSTLYRFDGL